MKSIPGPKIPLNEEYEPIRLHDNATERIIVYVNPETKEMVEDIISNPKSPWKTKAEFYRLGIYRQSRAAVKYFTKDHKGMVDVKSRSGSRRYIKENTFIDIWIKNGPNNGYSLVDILKIFRMPRTKANKKRIRNRLQVLQKNEVVWVQKLKRKITTRVANKWGSYGTRETTVKVNIYYIVQSRRKFQNRLRDFQKGLKLD